MNDSGKGFRMADINLKSIKSLCIPIYKQLVVLLNSIEISSKTYAFNTAQAEKSKNVSIFEERRNFMFNPYNNIILVPIKG